MVARSQGGYRFSRFTFRQPTARHCEGARYARLRQSPPLGGNASTASAASRRLATRLPRRFAPRNDEESAKTYARHCEGARYTRLRQSPPQGGNASTASAASHRLATRLPCRFAPRNDEESAKTYARHCEGARYARLRQSPPSGGNASTACREITTSLRSS